MKIYYYPEFDGRIRIYAVASKCDGACVIYDYLSNLTCNNADSIRIKIMQLILRIAVDKLRNTQKFKPLNGTGSPTLYELKHKEHRLYGVFADMGFLFLYCSGDKDKQKLDIKTAKRVRGEYLSDSSEANIHIKESLNGLH